MTDARLVLASYTLHALWLAPLLVVLGAIAARMLGPMGPVAMHRVRVCALLSAVVLPALPLLWATHLWRGTGRVDGLRVTASIVRGPGVAAAPDGLLHLPIVWVNLLCGLFLAGLVLSTVRMLRGLWGAAKLVRDAKEGALPAEFEQAHAAAAREFGIRVRVMVSDLVPGPVTLGLRRHVLLLPAAFACDATSEDMRVVMAHECAHMARRDFAWNALYEAVTLPIAVHPAVWLMKARVAESRELVCDALAVEHGIAPQSYVRSLLRLAMLLASAPAANRYAIGIFDANVLEERVMELRKKRKTLTVGVRSGLAVAGLLVMSLSAAAGAAAPRIAAPGDGQQSTKTDGPGADITPPRVTYSVEPKYPVKVHKGQPRYEGIVVLQLTVDPSGVPRDIKVVRSLNRPEFDQSAFHAAEQYRFRPAMKDGKPVPVRINLEVNFDAY